MYYALILFNKKKYYFYIHILAGKLKFSTMWRMMSKKKHDVENPQCLEK